MPVSRSLPPLGAHCYIGQALETDSRGIITSYFVLRLKLFRCRSTSFSAVCSERCSRASVPLVTSLWLLRITACNNEEAAVLVVASIKGTPDESPTIGELFLGIFHLIMYRDVADCIVCSSSWRTVHSPHLERIDENILARNLLLFENWHSAGKLIIVVMILDQLLFSAKARQGWDGVCMSCRPSLTKTGTLDKPETETGYEPSEPPFSSPL